MAEFQIRELTLDAQTHLLLPQRHWSEAINTILWSFPLAAAEEIQNELHFDDDDDGTLLMSKFSHVCLDLATATSIPGVVMYVSMMPIIQVATWYH